MGKTISDIVVIYIYQDQDGLARTVRYGLVGTGMMGVEHIQNLAITHGAELVAIADPVVR